MASVFLSSHLFLALQALFVKQAFCHMNFAPYFLPVCPCIFFFNFAKKNWHIIMQLNVSLSSFVTLGVYCVCPLLLSCV